MRPRDWFSVGVRLFGIWVIYDGFTYLVGFLAERVVQLSRSEFARDLEPRAASGYYIFFGIASLAFGFVLISGAERITRWLFGEQLPTENDDAHESS
jgi:hypothetical protein